MTNPLEPKPGFDWAKVRWTGPLAPVDETCSYCGNAIPDEHVPLRLWNASSWAAVFCYACMETWWGMQLLEEAAGEPRFEPLGNRTLFGFPIVEHQPCTDAACVLCSGQASVVFGKLDAVDDGPADDEKE